VTAIIMGVGEDTGCDAGSQGDWELVSSEKLGATRFRFAPGPPAGRHILYLPRDSGSASSNHFRRRSWLCDSSEAS